MLEQPWTALIPGRIGIFSSRKLWSMGGADYENAVTFRPSTGQ